MKGVVKWYLSGFYKKPQGLKKPYNPLLGETFRCYWQHPNGSRTFYLAEQVTRAPTCASHIYAQNSLSEFCQTTCASRFVGSYPITRRSPDFTLPIDRTALRSAPRSLPNLNFTVNLSLEYMRVLGLRVFWLVIRFYVL